METTYTDTPYIVSVQQEAAARGAAAQPPFLFVSL